MPIRLYSRHMSDLGEYMIRKDALLIYLELVHTVGKVETEMIIDYENPCKLAMCSFRFLNLYLKSMEKIIGMYKFDYVLPFLYCKVGTKKNHCLICIARFVKLVGRINFNSVQLNSQ